MVLRLFQPGDAVHFRSLNEEWIRQWFGLEEQDEKVLNDPQSSVLGPGGQILFAEIDGSPVGCCALIPGEQGEFELAKMAVAPAYRGQGIGRRLLDSAISLARTMGARSLLLGSNRKLESAIRLYESAGFEYVSADSLPPSPYARADVFMRLEL